MEGASKVREDKILTNEVMKVSIVIKKYWGDEITLMSTIIINHSHLKTCERVLDYFRDTVCENGLC